MRKALAALSVLALPFACTPASSTGTRAISGRVNAAQFHLSGAQIVAVSTSKHVYRAPIDATGAFTLALPPGATYTLKFANSTTNPSLFDSFAVLAPKKAGGSRTHWFTLTQGGAIDLGVIGSPSAKAVRDEMPDTPDMSMEGTDDEHDGDGVCDLSGGADEQEVDGDHDIMDDNDSDHDGVADSSDMTDDRADCTNPTAPGGDDCKHSDEDESKDEHDDDGACMGGGTGGTPTPPPVPGNPVP